MGISHQNRSCSFMITPTLNNHTEYVSRNTQNRNSQSHPQRPLSIQEIHSGNIDLFLSKKKKIDCTPCTRRPLCLSTILPYHPSRLSYLIHVNSCLILPHFFTYFKAQNEGWDKNTYTSDH